MAFTLGIGSPAPDFDLPGVDGRRYSPKDFDPARVLVVVFSCNHCPYVVGSEDRMIAFAKKYAPRDVAFVAINANETENHRRARSKPGQPRDGRAAHRGPRQHRTDRLGH